MELSSIVDNIGTTDLFQNSILVPCPASSESSYWEKNGFLLVFDVYVIMHGEKTHFLYGWFLLFISFLQIIFSQTITSIL